jgi:hypothetical protein
MQSLTDYGRDFIQDTKAKTPQERLRGLLSGRKQNYDTANEPQSITGTSGELVTFAHTS